MTGFDSQQPEQMNRVGSAVTYLHAWRGGSGLRTELNLKERKELLEQECVE